MVYAPLWPQAEVLFTVLEFSKHHHEAWYCGTDTQWQGFLEAVLGGETPPPKKKLATPPKKNQVFFKRGSLHLHFPLPPPNSINCPLKHKILQETLSGFQTLSDCVCFVCCLLHYYYYLQFTAAFWAVRWAWPHPVSTTAFQPLDIGRPCYVGPQLCAVSIHVILTL